jgi:hypothetical protein
MNLTRWLISLGYATNLIAFGLVALVFAPFAAWAVEARKKGGETRARRVAKILIGVEGALIALTLMGLAAMVVQAFLSAKASADSFRCTDHLRALSSAMLMYRTDWDEQLPPASRWSDAAMPYLSKPGVADLLPADELTSSHKSGDRNAWFKCPQSPTRYGYAANAAGFAERGPNVSYLTVMFFENNAASLNATGGKADLASSDRHGSTNYSKMDGSVHVANIYTTPEMAWTTGEVPPVGELQP